MTNIFKTKRIINSLSVLSIITLLGCANDDNLIKKDLQTSYQKNKSNNCNSEHSTTDDRILKTDAYQIVNDFTSLKNAIQNAPSGSIIYIEDNAIIETNSESLIIEKPITLASGRGINNSCGAVLKTASKTGRLLLVDASKNSIDGIRISGISFQGSLNNREEIENKIIGISLNKLDHCPPYPHSNEIKNVRIDNCGFSSFAKAAVQVNYEVNDNIIIENNFFNKNNRNGEGYGVGITSNGFALVTKNIFEDNRHDISCEGRKGSGYEFSYNILKNLGKNENIDTHGNTDIKFNCSPDIDNPHIAGTFFYVHHNIFKNEKINDSYDLNKNVLIRGIPEVMFLVENNKFMHKNDKGNVFICVSETFDAYGEYVFSFNNSYNGDLKDYIFPKKYYPNVSNISYLEIENTGDYVLDMMDVGCSDFDGDGVSEIFINKNNKWYYIDYPRKGKMHIRDNFKKYKWKYLGSSSYYPKDIKIADFNGDGKTDIFSTSRGNWQITFADKFQEGWQIVNYSPSYNLNNLKFGDFDGDGKTDTFKSSSLVWSISKGATTSWIDIGISEYDLNDLQIGEFNSNVTTDVFVSNEINWFYSDFLEGTSWQILNTSSELKNNLFAADLDNDGKTDIYKKYADSFKVSKGGNDNWQIFSFENFPNLLNR